MNDILAIKNYILYLKKTCKLAVTLHPHNSNLILKKELIAFNIHENPYCIYVKSCGAAQNHCIETHKKIVKKCKDGNFVGTCWAGVKEFVYPIFQNENIVGFICVSGYADERGAEYISSVENKYDLDGKQLQSAYGALKKTMPDKSYVDTLIYPLCYMLELAHLKAQSSQKEDTLIRQMLHYIKKNYTQNITAESLCEEFHYSRSHLSKIFNTEMKMTLREYLTNIRLEAAKGLLLYTKLDVSEIALSVGFNEAYYFTTVFKKHTSLTPLQYRKKHLSEVKN